MRHLVASCPNCGAMLLIDEVYMDDTFGAMWRGCISSEDVSMWCPGCGEAGTYDELVEIYGDPDAH